MLECFVAGTALLICALFALGAVASLEQQRFEARLPKELRAIVQGADLRARQLHHEYIGTEHLLIALLERNDELDLTFDRSQVNSFLQTHISAGPEMLTTGKLPLTPKARRALTRVEEGTAKRIRLQLLGGFLAQECLAADALQAGGLLSEAVQSALAEPD